MLVDGVQRPGWVEGGRAAFSLSTNSARPSSVAVEDGREQEAESCSLGYRNITIQMAIFIYITTHVSKIWRDNIPLLKM